MLAWVFVIMMVFSFVVAIMDIRGESDWAVARQVDGTITAYKRSRQRLVVMYSVTNPFTQAQEEAPHRYSGSIEDGKAEYVIGSLHRVWVSPSGYKRLQHERPDARYAYGFVIIGLVLAVISGAIFWFTRESPTL